MGATGATGATGPTGATPPLNALYVTNAAAQNPAATGDPLTFDTTQLAEGTAVTHTGGSSDITLTENGVYQISYSTVGTDTTGAGTTSVQLQEDGTEIPGTTSAANVANANDQAALSGTAIVDVTSAPVTITLNSIGTNQQFSNTGVSVRKLD